MDQKRIAFFHLDSLAADTHPRVICTYVLNQCLEFTVTVLGTGGAVLRMSCQQKLQRQGTQFIYPLCFRVNYHAIFRPQCTGRGHALLTLHLHNTHTAGAILRQIRMMT